MSKYLTSAHNHIAECHGYDIGQSCKTLLIIVFRTRLYSILIALPIAPILSAWSIIALEENWGWEKKKCGAMLGAKEGAQGRSFEGWRSPPDQPKLRSVYLAAWKTALQSCLITKTYKYQVLCSIWGCKDNQKHGLQELTGQRGWCIYKNKIKC